MRDTWKKILFAGVVPYCVFGVLAVALTWPLAAHLNDAYPSTALPSGGDTNMYVWNIDWLAKAVTGQLPVGAGRMVFFPAGVDVWAAYEGPAIFLLGAGFVLLGMTPVAALNVCVLLGLLTSALAAFWLVRWLTRSDAAAYFAGLTYGFAPFFLIRSTLHQHLLLGAALPWVVYAVLVFFERPGAKRGAGLAASLFVCALVSWYYLFAALIFLDTAGIYFRKVILKNLRAAEMAAYLILLACLIPAWPILVHNVHTSLGTDAHYTASLGVQPLNLIVPHPYTAIGMFSRAVYDQFPSSYVAGPNDTEASSYLGLPLLLLLIWTLARLRRGVPYRALWLWSLAIIFAVALGTGIQIGPWRLPMPYAALLRVFPFSFFRSVNRLFIFAFLIITIVASYGVAHIQALQKKSIAYLLLGLLFLLLLAERLMLPYPVYAKPVPDFYRQLTKDPALFAIADIPEAPQGFSEYNFFQTVHGKPIVTGEFFYPAYNNSTFAFIKANALLAGSLCPTPAIPQQDTGAALSALAAENIRYVVVHNFTLTGDPQCGQALVFVRKFFQGQVPVYADGEITVYPTQPDAKF